MMVTEVHDQTLSGSIFDAYTNGVKALNGIRYCKDPELSRRGRMGDDSGCWDYTNKDKRLFANFFEEMAAEIEAVKKGQREAVKQAQKQAA